MNPFLLICSLLISIGGVFLFNNLPDRWFLDYDEVAGEQKRRLLPLLLSAFIFCGVMTCTWLAAGFYLTGAVGLLVLFLLWFSLMISSSDILYHILPDQFIIGIALVGIAFIALDFSHLLVYLLGGVIGGGVLLLIGLIGKLVYKAEAMGFGDVKLMAAIGLVCGLPGIFYALAIALITGAIAAVPMLIHKRDERQYLPFAPFLCLGGVAAIIFAKPLADLLHWYLSLFA